MGTKITYIFIKSEFFWVALGCVLFKVWFNSQDAADTFGDWIDFMKKLNATVLWVSALLSGKRFFDFIVSIRKMPDSISDIPEQPKIDE